MADGSDTAGGRLGEFGRIARFFRPLTNGVDGALNLEDDAALLSAPDAGAYALSVDTLTEGIHFIGDEPPDLIARKAVRVNLSDLAGMGARPVGYFLALSLPPTIDDEWVAEFARGLAEDQAEFGWSLLGGDSTSSEKRVSVTVTAVGDVAPGSALRRSGGKPGDAVFVSGSIGDAAFGLGVAQGRFFEIAETKPLLDRYRLPQPRVELGLAMAGVAHAGMDISDGLVADLRHLCEASGVGARIEAAEIPLSGAASSLIADDPSLFIEALTGGDDYELLVCGPEDAILEAAAEIDVSLRRIGRLVETPGIAVVDRDGHAISFEREGYRHD